MSAADLAFSSLAVKTKSPMRIALLGGFDLMVDDVPVAVPVGSKRLLAFIALNYRASVPRSLVAGSLWPDASEHSAYTNLRAALSRLRGTARKALDVSSAEVRLARDVTVDLYHSRSLAQRLLDPGGPVEDLRLNAATVDQLSADLLPGWYDDWALLEAEHWRQLRLHALEALAGEFIDAKEFAGAVSAAHAAVQADPLRESSQASLIRAHLAEGNPSEALSDFERYAQRLRDELGLRPTQRLHRLVAELQRSRPRNGSPRS
ncbi:BTAD domain-containing putative transcriptional regulator [Streptomyces yaanensis]|uniref:BTAD domain-containing putative transcriptional regulator n=1 Tax=Streptomyces yaanensis TaxID=1142239 RepID=A0ABV7SF83_9ACTN|nr:BTAD domain-containing putative transcriptional regulator [Streptomyces sp. CGMCC 4.7035]WNB97762.1 BTAD domain-containing putative transcriptional regulator [Streptomyces sp. CGMCC 4.7035]